MYVPMYDKACLTIIRWKHQNRRIRGNTKRGLLTRMCLVGDQQRGLCIHRENTLLTSSVSRRGISIEPDITVGCRLINLLADQGSIQCRFRLVVLFLFTNFRLIGWWFMVGLSRLKYCLRISFIVYILKCCSTGKLIWVMDFKNSNLILRGLYEFLKIPLYFSV